MEEVYIDLSDKIFIHRDFVEVVGLKIPKGTTLVEWFEQYIFDNEGKVVKFQLSVWQEFKGGIKLESTLVTLEIVYVIMEGKVEVVGLEYY